MKAILGSREAVEPSKAIDNAAIRERILQNAVTVAEWATARLVRDRNGESIISDLYADYDGYCRREKVPPLPRKGWIVTMKLAGFQTQSGAFVGLILKEMTGNFATISRA